MVEGTALVSHLGPAFRGAIISSQQPPACTLLRPLPHWEQLFKLSQPMRTFSWGIQPTQDPAHSNQSKWIPLKLTAPEIPAGTHPRFLSFGSQSRQGVGTGAKQRLTNTLHWVMAKAYPRITPRSPHSGDHLLPLTHKRGTSPDSPGHKLCEFSSV